MKCYKALFCWFRRFAFLWTTPFKFWLSKGSFQWESHNKWCPRPKCRFRNCRCYKRELQGAYNTEIRRLSFRTLFYLFQKLKTRSQRFWFLNFEAKCCWVSNPDELFSPTKLPCILKWCSSLYRWLQAREWIFWQSGIAWDQCCKVQEPSKYYFWCCRLPKGSIFWNSSWVESETRFSTESSICGLGTSKCSFR